MKNRIKTAFVSFTVIIVSGIQTATAADLAKGKSLFAERCASCHGNAGAGDGPLAAALPPEHRPRNLKDGNFKFAVNDAKFKELLQKGGAAVGLNPLMTGAPGVDDAGLESLIAFVHSLQK